MDAARLAGRMRGALPGAMRDSGLCLLLCVVCASSARGADLTGSWDVSFDQYWSNCGVPLYVGSYTGSIQQSGNSLALSFLDQSVSGSTSGTSFSVPLFAWSGSDTAGAAGTLSVAPDGGSFSGSVTWTWSNGAERCRGKAIFAAPEPSQVALQAAAIGALALVAWLARHTRGRGAS